MPRRTAKISPSDLELEKEENMSEQNEEAKDIDVLALKDLKSLIYLGRLSETLNIDGFSFEISTLTTAQQRDVMTSIMSDENTTQRMLDIKPLTLSYSIRSINGVKLEDICDDDSITELESRRLNVVMSLQSTLVERLYVEYDNLVTRSGKNVGIEDLKG